MSERTTLGVVGLLILAAFPLYGGGQALLTGDSWKLGLGLCLINSAAVLMIGVLMNSIIAADAPTTGRIYMVARMGEGILLALGVLAIVGMNVTGLSGDDFYRLAMTSLGLGSLYMCRWLITSARVLAAIGWLGFVGYVGLILSMATAHFGQEILSMVLLLPGAVFEIIFGIVLVLGKVRTSTFSGT